MITPKIEQMILTIADKTLDAIDLSQFGLVGDIANEAIKFIDSKVEERIRRLIEENKALEEDAEI